MEEVDKRMCLYLQASRFWSMVVQQMSSLRERFRCLFDLAKNKSNIVAEMYALGWEDGGGA
jgi:hypothetical protein